MGSPTMSRGPLADTVPSRCHDACQMEISEENVRQRVESTNATSARVKPIGAPKGVGSRSPRIQPRR
jgi:hypothetical protein